ncbi:MAG TPA: hypothetical protein VN851_20960 [Thermoanaerobaculia bacterium]|nr:hypothetical protein [Thermoanaerobaculia bacterium]
MRRAFSLLPFVVLAVGCSSQGSRPVAKGEPVRFTLPSHAAAARVRTDPAVARSAEQEDPAEYAWTLFLALNDPWNQPGTKVWETDFRQTSTVYLADGSEPPPWGTATDPPDLPPIPANGCVPPGVRHNLDTAIQVDGRDLLDKWGQSVRYQLLMNQATFDYIVARRFYNVNGQELAASNGQKADFPPTSYELKTSWLWLGTDAARCAEVRDKFYVVNAYYQLFDRDGQPRGWQVGYAALAGMHIINKSQPNWVWITFENVYDPQFTAARLELPIAPEIQAANQFYQGALAGSVFANYQLDGVQTEFNVPGSNPPQPTLLANSTIESAFQPQSSCITCHHLASIKPDGEYFNLTYTQGGNVNYYVGTPPPLGDYTFLDYVWSMKRAHRQTTESWLQKGHAVPTQEGSR